MDDHRPALNRLPRWFVATLAAGPLAALLGWYVWPMANIVARAVAPGVVADTLGAPGVWRVVWFTTWQAAASTALTLAVGLPVTWLVARLEVRGRRPLLALVTVPFLLPTVVVGAAFAALLPDAWVGTTGAVLVAHVFFNVAVVVRVVGGLWGRLPHDLGHAAATLGAAPWQVFRRVTLPLLAPAIGGAAGIVYAFSFTSYGVVRVLGDPASPTLEVEVARRATQLGDVGGAAVLSVLQLVALVAVAAAAARTQRGRPVSLAGATGPRPPRRHQRRPALAVAGLTGAVMAAPLVALVVRSVRVRGSWSLAGWRALVWPVTDRPGAAVGVDAVEALQWSLRAALVAALVSTIIGGLAVFSIAASGRAGKVLDGALALPLATSAVTLGLGLLITFDTAPVDWRARWWFVPLGQALVAIPFVVRALLPAVRSVPEGLRDAAATLGASPLRVWREVDLRMVGRPLLAAGAFAAAISLGEFGATSVLSRSGSDTVPMVIESLLGRTGDLPRAQGFALATVLLVLTGALVAFADPVAGQHGTWDDARRR